jgi:hypothetical protein
LFFFFEQVRPQRGLEASLVGGNNYKEDLGFGNNSTRVQFFYKKEPRKIKKKAIGSFFSTASARSWAMVAGGDAGDCATWFVTRMDHHAKIEDLPL